MGDELASLLHLIAGAAARHGYRRLYPLLFSGRDGRDASYDTKVLKDADIDELILTPARINLESPCRPFFEKCCLARNPSALYIEGLRLVVQGGPIAEAIQMLRTAAKDLKSAIFAASLVLICNGELEQANTAMAPLCVGHPPGRPLYTTADLEEANAITDDIFRQLSVLGACKGGRFTWTWNHPTPPCQEPCEKEYCDCVFH